MSFFSHIADDSFASWFAAITNRDRDTVHNVNNNTEDGNTEPFFEERGILNETSGERETYIIEIYIYLTSLTKLSSFVF